MKVLGRWISLGLAACLVSAGCKKEEPAPATPPAPPAAPPAPPAAPPTVEPTWTAGLVDVQRSTLPPVTLREVRSARNEGFDRVVFQFDGDQVPGYHLEYLDKPALKCGSGDPTVVAGQGWLQVRIQPARAHENAQVTVADRERKPGLPVLQELELTCDFEAEVTWVLGVRSPNKYRVLELHQPTRLVVDLQH